MGNMSANVHLDFITVYESIIGDLFKLGQSDINASIHQLAETILQTQVELLVMQNFLVNFMNETLSIHYAPDYAEILKEKYDNQIISIINDADEKILLLIKEDDEVCEFVEWTDETNCMLSLTHWS